MKNMKSFFLGSALVVAAATGAQAADPIYDVDLDVKAPREPVYRCDETGFIELPGTDICFNVRGFTRLRATYRSEDWSGDDASGIATDPYYTGLTLAADGDPLTITYPNRIDDGFDMDATGRLGFDFRTATEWGTLRGYIEMEATDNNTNTGGAFNMRHAYVQFGNWVLGKTWSLWGDGDALANSASPYTNIGDVTTRTDQIRYTQSFGNGWSAAIAIEDSRQYQANQIQRYYGYTVPTAAQLGMPGPDVATTYNDNENMPDVTGAIEVTGDWGHARLSGVLSQVNTQYNVTTAALGLTTTTETDLDDELGWGVNFGLGLNAPMIGPDDNLVAQFTYTDGVSGGRHGFLAGSNVVVSSDCNGDATLGDWCVTDTVTAWSAHGGFQHYWTPNVNSTIGGGYQHVDFGTNTQFTAVNETTNTYVLGDGDADVWELFANVEWTPINNLRFMLEGRYGSVDRNFLYAYDLDEDGDTDLTLDGDNDAFSISFNAVRSF